MAVPNGYTYTQGRVYSILSTNGGTRMYTNAYKCNACGSISRSGGTHCNANMVSVVVMDNLFQEREGSTSSPTIVVREVASKQSPDRTWEAFK